MIKSTMIKLLVLAGMVVFVGLSTSANASQRDTVIKSYPFHSVSAEHIGLQSQAPPPPAREDPEKIASVPNAQGEGTDLNPSSGPSSPLKGLLERLFFFYYNLRGRVQ